MKQLFIILAILAMAITAHAEGDYYDYSNPTTITIGGDGTVIFGDGNTMNPEPIEIDESLGDSVEIDPEAETQAVGIIRVDAVPLYIMITNLTETTQTCMLEVGTRTWLYSIAGSSGTLLSAELMIDYGPPQAVRLTSAPGTVLLERVQP